MTTTTKHICQFTVDETVAMILLGRPFTTLRATEPAYRELSMVPDDQRSSYVLENSNWNVGYDNIALPNLPDGEYRLWSRRDWENCDNRRNNTVARLERLHQERIAIRGQQRDTVKRHLMATGVAEAIVDMLLGTMNDEQLATMVATIERGQ